MPAVTLDAMVRTCAKVGSSKGHVWIRSARSIFGNAFAKGRGEFAQTELAQPEFS
jgi:hypothetical protein